MVWNPGWSLYINENNSIAYMKESGLANYWFILFLKTKNRDTGIEKQKQILLAS